MLFPYLVCLRHEQNRQAGIMQDLNYTYSVIQTVIAEPGAWLTNLAKKRCMPHYKPFEPLWSKTILPNQQLGISESHYIEEYQVRIN
jgi:hypothetical protein